MIRFTVPGDPVGQGRARSTKSGMHYTPARTRKYEAAVAAAAGSAMRVAGLQPLTCPVRLIVECRFAVPVSWPSWKRQDALDQRILPTCRPDLDNVLKAVKDGLNGIAWTDDAQVVVVVGEKYYWPRAEVEVCIEPVSAASANAKRGDIAA